MKILFKKTLLIALVAALATASLPLVSASAMQTSASTSQQEEPTGERLEKIWAHQLKIFEKIGNILDRSDAFVERVQNLIDRADENGKDVSEVQAALDAFEQALKDVHPIYESAKGIINSHQGFDSDGKVTDFEKARETVKSMGEKLREIKDAMGGAGRALHEAIQAFREANPRPQRNQSAPESE